MNPDPPNRKPNRLAGSTSPYLQQHAYNPVDWYEWGPEALSRAKAEDKPILVSIGYSSCHWCHVMERESFENPEIATVMNEHLVCIKVDREERPDIDQVYMDAVQAMGLNGGWPLNVFLTPDQKPFYGGTYFRPQHWSQLITQLSKAFHERKEEITKSAEDLTQHLNNSDVNRFVQQPGAFTQDDFQAAFSALESRFDAVNGGLDRAPKFVMPTIWLWLLRHHHQTQNGRALNMVLHTLRQLANGGIYDQLGGGFARYSVDAEWFAPHFEKMLYDNAQLISLYAEAYRVTPDPRFREIVEETIDWLQQEMLHPEGGFYSALDADSEGEEGKFYTWTSEELQELLGADGEQFCNYYSVTPAGNWENGQNILHRKGLTPHSSDEHRRLEEGRRTVLALRNKRIRPGLDDKVLTGWNGMLITGLTDAFKAFGEPAYLRMALNAATFLESKLIEAPRCYRAFKGRRSKTEGFLEDYAHLLQAWIALYECTFDDTWIRKAETICDYVLDHFHDEQDGFFFGSSSKAEKLIARKKDLFDNVIPSANSVMARNLHRLGILLDRSEWKELAHRMTSRLASLILKEPGYLSNWAMAAQEVTVQFHETVITGPKAEEFRNELMRTYLPFTIFMGGSKSSSLPLVKDRLSAKETLIHICVDNVCQLPVKSVSEALQLLSSRSQ